MSGRLRPGMIVRGEEGISIYDGDGLILSERQKTNGTPVFLVEWGDAAQIEYTSTQLRRPEPTKVKAGDSWLSHTVDEVDMTAEVMKVRMIEGQPGTWIDVRLFGLPLVWARKAAEIREAAIAADRQKADWFKPGQIVVNKRTSGGPLARPATVVLQESASDVKVITSNGIATVPFEELVLSANSVQDLQAKMAQKQQDTLDAFKAEVRDKALDVKREHDLCSEVDQFLSDLGIKIPVNKVRAVLHLTVEVDAVIAQGTGMNRLDLERQINREWWGKHAEVRRRRQRPPVQG